MAAVLAVVIPAPPGVNHDFCVPDLAEKMTLVYYEEDRFEYHCRILWVNLGGGRWIVSSPSRDTFEEDFAGEAIVPLVRGGQYPLGGYRPIFGFGPITAAEYAQMRSDAYAIAEVFGHVPAVPLLLADDCVWLFSDPSLDSFGTPVPIELTTNAARMRAEGSVGLVEVDTSHGRAWRSMDRILRDDLEAWRQEKRTGGGRDPRLLPLNISIVEPPLYREAVLLSKPVLPLPKQFRGPRSLPEWDQAVVSSGMEPPAYANAWIAASGVAPKSGVATEFLMGVTTLWLLKTIDGMDTTNSAAAEHTARRLLQLQRAVRRSPRSPDFSGLDWYVEHVTVSSVGASAPEFEKHVADMQRVEGQIMKSQRIQVEETEALSKVRKANAKKKAKEDE
jgi:hypothetical protein